MKFIYETVVYCGRTKVWRVLNMNTGTVYSMDYETQEEAVASIEDGKERAGCTVKYVPLFTATDDVHRAETQRRWEASQNVKCTECGHMANDPRCCQNDEELWK